MLQSDILDYIQINN